MFHLNGNDFQQHCNNIGQYLRELRLKRDLSTVDVEIICDQMQTDFLHSSVGAVHSNYIRTMLRNHQMPFRISLLNYQYKIISAIIDWMYTGEIQVTMEEYGEYLKAVNSLGINKLQQNLENTLEALAEQNDYIICCINIATNPECSVSSIVRGIICEKFVATMHTLLDTDIQKLTLNAVTALVASPCTKSKEKIDAVNFALQWLKNPAHLRFLDVVLESLYIEALRSNQLIALVQHLRRLYQELPKSLLAPFHIYLCDEEIVVGSEPKKFTESSSAAVSNSCADVNETESKCKSTEFEEMIDVKLSTSSSVKIKKMPNFEELIKIYQPINRNIQELTDVYQPTNTDNQELTGAHTFVSNDFAEYQQISNLSAKRISQGQKFFKYPNDTESFLDIRLAAAGTLDEKSEKAAEHQSLRSHGLGNISGTSNQLSPESNDIMTATSAEERTIGRNAFSSDSLAEIQKTQNPFSDESTNQLPTLLSNRSGIMEHPRNSDRAVNKQHALLNSPEQPYIHRTFGTEKLGDLRNIPDQSIYRERNLFSPSTKTINRNLYGTESVTDIASIPEQFYNKRYFTPNLDHYLGGSRAVYNLTEQIRQTKDRLYGFESFRNMRNDWRNRGTSQRSNLQVVNRYVFGEQSLADIADIGNQFSMKDYKKNHSSEVPRSASYRIGSMTDMKAISDPFAPKETASFQDYPTQPHTRYTASEIEDINAYPEFVREDHLIGKKALTREEYEELRAIPSITDNESEKLPIINRYELPDDELDDIRNLPDIVDSQYAIGRGIRSDEEIQTLSDIHSPSPASDAKLSTAQSIHIRPSSGMASSGLQSAYVAPGMYSQHFNSNVSSDYIVHRP